jgi:hypothetical protein
VWDLVTFGSSFEEENGRILHSHSFLDNVQRVKRFAVLTVVTEEYCHLLRCDAIKSDRSLLIF